MKKSWLCLAIALTSLVGCGGGGGGDDGKLAEPPVAPPAQLSWGQPDATYGVAGRLTVGAPLDGGTIYGPSRMTVLPDGGLYVKGWTELTRLDPRGLPLASFGDGGRVSPEPVFGVSSPYAPAVVDEAGNAYVITRSGVFKFGPGGDRISAFGTGGVASVDNAFELRRDGVGNLYVVSRRIGESGSGVFEVTKLDRDGRPVSSFGVAGKAVLEIGQGSQELSVSTTFVDPEGNLYAAGWFGSSTQVSWAFVSKFDANGHRVATFSGVAGSPVPTFLPCFVGGLTATTVPYAHATSVAVDAAGNVFLALQCGQRGGPPPEPFIVKLDSRGSVDQSFAAALRSVPVLLGSGGATVNALIAKPNGELIIAGSRSTCVSQVIVAKLDPTGNAIALPNGDTTVVLEGAFPSELGLDGYGRLHVGAGRFSACSPHTRMEPVLLVYRMGS